MKKSLTQLYNFLGGVLFAIFLIVLTSALVVAGTLMESRSGSHEYAATNVYDTLLFTLVLWGFFVNILISSLRRWPFRKKHVPFLITHLGLLMILGGALVKRHNGVQGVMFLLEGSKTDKLLLPHTYALRVDSLEREAPLYLEVPLNKTRQITPDLSIKKEQLFPNSLERLDTFIKGRWVVSGLAPPFPSDTRQTARLLDREWSFLSKNTASFQKEIANNYTQNAILEFSLPGTKETIYTIKLEEALKTTFQIEEKKVSLLLEFSINNLDGLTQALLIANIDGARTQIPLTGPHALANIRSPTLGKSKFFDIDIVCQPALLFLQDANEGLFLAAIGPHGDIDGKVIRQDAPGPLYAYNQGFDGYSTQTTLRIANKGRSDLEEEQKTLLKQQLINAVAKNEKLSPPLNLLYTACRQEDVSFPDVCIDFLASWHKTGKWLYPKNHPLSEKTRNVLEKIDWSVIPEKERKGCSWFTTLYQGLESELDQGADLLTLLDRHQWPFIEEIKTSAKEKNPNLAWSLYTHQIFAIADELPATSHQAADENAQLLSSYCREYDIHLSTICPEHWTGIPWEEIVLECPLTTNYKVVPPTVKIEENKPLLVLQVKNSQNEQIIALGYDSYAKGLRWPTADGKNLLRFQPMVISIPYEIRLRRARQISYPNTNQPYSYESDLIITDKRTGAATEASISMNNVHETWDGFRFYLSNMSPADESNIKHIQLAVNRDPAKHYLTYPGALILSLGIILLFWFRA